MRKKYAGGYRRDWPPCKLCNKRKQRYVNGLCEPCEMLTRAEGTKKQLGIETETLFRIEARKYVAEYNKLIRAGMLQTEIAAKWGRSIQALRTYLYRVRKRHPQIKVLSAYVARAKIRDKGMDSPWKRAAKQKTVHGVKWGVRGCACELCVTSKRNARNEYNRAWRAKQRLEREAAKNNAMPDEG